MSWDLVGVLSRWAVFTGLLVAVGALVFRFRILSGAELDPEGEAGAAAPIRSAPRLAALAALLVLLGAAGRLAAELAIFRDPFEPWLAEMRLLVGETSFGRAWRAQVVLALLACLAFLGAAGGAEARGRPPAWLAAGLLTVALAWTPAFSGHAIGSADWRTLAVVSDGVHVVAGGVWLGTLAVIARSAARARSLGHPVPRERLVRWIGRFSPFALVAAATLAVTGVVASWLHLDAVSSLWTTTYGRRLLIKLGVLAVILAFGAYNWRRSRGKIAVSGDPARLPGSVAAELAAGLVILLVTALLVTTPPPGE